MAGRNIFESAQRSGFSACTSSFCVFVSHNSKDKPMARAVAKALLDMGVDIYFDERDVILQSASAAGSDSAIVKCIEDGLSKSTHLLGLITKNTFQSWWVPYEIGGANGRSKMCGHLVSYDVDRLPSYIKVAPLLFDIDDLAGWVSKRLPRTKVAVMESMVNTTKSLLESYVPSYRSRSNVTFY